MFVGICGAVCLLGISRQVRCCILFKPRCGSSKKAAAKRLRSLKSTALYAFVLVSDCDEHIRDPVAAMRSFRQCYHAMMKISIEKSFSLNVTAQPTHFDTIQACLCMKRLLGVSRLVILV